MDAMVEMTSGMMPESGISKQPSNDYAIVRETVEFLTDNWRDHPGLDEIAGHVGLPPLQVQRLFTRWAGLTPKAFLQAITLDPARALLRDSASVLDTSYEVGLSGPARLHDLFVTHEAMTPGVCKASGQGIEIRHAFHPCPFGQALFMATDHGLAGLAFADDGNESEALEDMMKRWPNAVYRHDSAATAAYAARVFDQARWTSDAPLRISMIGSDFEIRVWETLLRIPMGKLTTYSDIAAHLGKPSAARAVGTAVGKNPISFVVPCHRVIGKTGSLCGYHWGLTRKRAIIGWETGALASLAA